MNEKPGTSNAACVAFVALLWDALAADPPVRPGFWLNRFISSRIEGGYATVRAQVRPLHGPAHDGVGIYRGGRHEWAPGERSRRCVEACNGWYSGAFLLETVPSVLYILERHGNDPEDAITRAPSWAQPWGHRTGSTGSHITGAAGTSASKAMTTAGLGDHRTGPPNMARFPVNRPCRHPERTSRSDPWLVR
jgi:hypothetical protein